MEIEVLELRWWLEGQSEGGDTCSSRADCQPVVLPRSREGFRCQCLDGFHGDDYFDGLGCRKGSLCCKQSMLFLILTSTFNTWCMVSFLVTVMGSVVPWSTTLALVDAYYVFVNFPARQVRIMTLVIVGDWLPHRQPAWRSSC